MKTLQLTSGDYVFVDDEDFEWLDKWKWCLKENKFSGNKYAQRTSSPQISMHRLILQTPKGMYSDHVNHNGLDNRRSNLRIVTASENQRNLRKKCNAVHDFPELIPE